MYFLYILRSQKTGKFYVGITTDINRRMSEHNGSKQHLSRNSGNLSRSLGKKNTFTSKHRPWELMALYQISTDVTLAVKIEKYIKQQKSVRIIEHLCNPDQIENKLPLMLQKMKKVL
jgi:putative endonuclease